MGIDIYLNWRAQKKAEAEAQQTGFSVVHGHVGYLREAYHGEPYVTHYLFSEVFEGDRGYADIPAAVLRSRLPRALELAEVRERTVYQQTDPEALAAVKRSFVDFVELAEAKERGSGVPCTIIASY